MDTKPPAPMPEIRADSETAVTGRPACIAFDPTRPDLFVIGTYNLDEAGIKSGELLLYTYRQLYP